MTAETTGKSVWISRWKDLEIVDILGKNDRDSFMVCDQEDYQAAVTHFGEAARVWIHDVEASNADNRICFRIVNSSAWTIENGTLANEIKWPRPECRDVCRPCQGGER